MLDQTTPRIQSLACAVPERRYTQHEIHALNPWEDNALIDKLFLDSAVHSRGLFVPPEWYQGNSTLSQTNQAWKEGALLLGGQVLVEACFVFGDEMIEGALPGLRKVRASCDLY